jgi:glycine/D-amino acid oxidase-like deaminating enzyme/nitrite reductase/ring-hydroxylating ferredoxin subunit
MKQFVINEPIWNRNARTSSFPSLSESIETDIAIVGGGITGITAAYLLSKSGKKVVLLESGSVGMGTTGFSTGNLYVPIDELLFSIADKHGDEVAKEVAASRASAIDFIERIVNEYNIECGFQRLPWHVFTSDESEPKSENVKNESVATLKMGVQASSAIPEGFPLEVSDITTISNQAQFNPFTYTARLASVISPHNCRIFENTTVTNISDGDPCIVETDQGTIKAKKVVVATHSPKGVYAVHAAMEVRREFAIAAKLWGDLPQPGIYWHYHKGEKYSFRPVHTSEGDFLLALGGSYKVGNTEDGEENFKKLEEYLNEHFEVESIHYTWAAQNYRPAGLLPYIGNSFAEDNVFIATGFAADGLVYGTLAAQIITDQILEKENPYSKLYDPKRITPLASAGNVIKDNLKVGKELLKDYLFYDRKTELDFLENGEGKTLKLDNEKIAAYRDMEGKLHLVSSVCTHMGCIVHWNGLEKSWDCPCHGSRFSVDGDVIEGPAIEALAKPKENEEED